MGDASSITRRWQPQHAIDERAQLAFVSEPLLAAMRPAVALERTRQEGPFTPVSVTESSASNPIPRPEPEHHVDEPVGQPLLLALETPAQGVLRNAWRHAALARCGQLGCFGHDGGDIVRGHRPLDVLLEPFQRVVVRTH